MSLCDYELQRLANIAENKQKLAALNLSGSGGAREKKVKRTGTKRSKVPDHAAPAEQKSMLKPDYREKVYDEEDRFVGMTKPLHAAKEKAPLPKAKRAQAVPRVPRQLAALDEPLCEDVVVASASSSYLYVSTSGIPRFVCYYCRKAMQPKSGGLRMRTHSDNYGLCQGSNMSMNDMADLFRKERTLSCGRSSAAEEGGEPDGPVQP